MLGFILKMQEEDTECYFIRVVLNKIRLCLCSNVIY
jgi:hypothetical protein